MVTRKYTTGRAGADVVTLALCVLEQRIREPGINIGSPQLVYDFLRLTIGASNRERFFVFYVDTQLRLIEPEEMFRGTLRSCPVFPRDIAKRALELDADGVFLAHNHPSGACAQSSADEALTWSISEALALFDIRVIDHLIVAGVKVFSFLQKGIPLRRPAPEPVVPKKRTRRCG